jgi:hypothetical protein
MAKPSFLCRAVGGEGAELVRRHVRKGFSEGGGSDAAVGGKELQAHVAAIDRALAKGATAPRAAVRLEGEDAQLLSAEGQRETLEALV